MRKPTPISERSSRVRLHFRPFARALRNPNRSVSKDQDDKAAVAADTRMISSLFKRKPQTVTAPAVPSTPDGVVVWAVGDIHGRLDLLEPLTQAILDDAGECEADRKVVIFLGDYIDRGPDSRGVLRHLIDLPKDAGVEWRFLKGNHEEAMLRFLDEPDFGPQWCEYGGDATLASYGLRPPDMRHRTEAWARVSADLEHYVSDDERAFLTGLELSVAFGSYFFSHAGARPGVPLDRQTDRDLMWIRNSFLDSDSVFEKVVVHGHTPTDEPHVDHRRVGVDTRAYKSGRLTATRLEGPARTILQVSKGAGQIETLRWAV